MMKFTLVASLLCVAAGANAMSNDEAIAKVTEMARKEFTASVVFRVQKPGSADYMGQTAVLAQVHAKEGAFQVRRTIRVYRVAPEDLAADPVMIAAAKKRLKADTWIDASIDDGQMCVAAPGPTASAMIKIRQEDGTWFGAKLYGILLSQLDSPGTHYLQDADDCPAK
ncbi:MAG: hypothetical protein WC421_08740 [Elusimicrobiales bacterium]